MMVDANYKYALLWLDVLEEHFDGASFINLFEESIPNLNPKRICIKGSCIENRPVDDGWAPIPRSRIIGITSKFLPLYTNRDDLISLKTCLDWIFTPILNLSSQHRAINNLMEEIQRHLDKVPTTATESKVVSDHPATPLRQQLQQIMKKKDQLTTFIELKKEYREWLRVAHPDKQSNHNEKIDESVVKNATALWYELLQIAPRTMDRF
ncbi:MAG: hypothetical protein WC222_01400 [Parachlamydiales bacterium]